jgi:hypothetical protein
MKTNHCVLFLAVLCNAETSLLRAQVAAATTIRGQIVDADSGRPLPARVYVESENGTWHYPTSQGGTAVQYCKSRPDNPRSVEMHTTLSAHPFAVDLGPGKYTFTIERGKEYHPERREITVAGQPLDVTFGLHRWIDIAKLGWYSGDTHVHRSLEELPNLLLAEDLNVAFPLLDWTREAFVSPLAARKEPFQDAAPQPNYIDATHVYYPRNTEYELFTVNRKSHTLGAFFALNHRTVFDVGAPPVRNIAERIHSEGGLIELDKHNWPWTTMLIPVMQPDLYELSNNHVWRTEFAFGGWGESAPPYMHAERDGKGLTEWGWLDSGFQHYYALLNCGFRIRPTAGTASGVHPVPLGFGRVYVYCPEKFTYELWLSGLNAGRSFVTTGPMLFVSVDGQSPGHVFHTTDGAAREYRVHGSATSSQPLDRFEIIVNGEIVRTIKPTNQQTAAAAFENQLDDRIPIDGTSWIAIRCFEVRSDKRIRFAHSSPVHIDMPSKPIRPRKAEINFLMQRVNEQLNRNEGVLPNDSLAEYRVALAAYKRIAEAARGND